MLVAVLLRRVGGPLVALRTSGRLDILSWQAMLRRCPGQTAALFLGQTTRAGVASWRTRARKVRGLPMLPRDLVASGRHTRGFGARVCRLLRHPLPGMNWRSRGGGGVVVALSMPLLGQGGMVARLSRSPQSCGRNASSSRSFDREQDHVIAETGRHELEAPEPNHHGARNRRNKGGHLERNGKWVKNT